MPGSWTGGSGANPPPRGKVPAHVTLYHRRARSPREWAGRELTVALFTRMPRGGHRAVLEVPKLVAKDLALLRAGLDRSPPAGAARGSRRTMSRQ